MREHKLRVVNGAPFMQEAMDVFRNEFGVEKVIEGFGMTEIPGAFSNPYDGPHKVAKHILKKDPTLRARAVDFRT